MVKAYLIILVTSVGLSIFIGNYGMESHEIIIEESMPVEVASCWEEQNDAVHFFQERYTAIHTRAAACFHDPEEVLQIWNQEEDDVQKLPLNSPIMCEQYQIYRADIAKEKEMLEIFMRSQQRAKVVSNLHETIQLARNGQIEKAKETLERVNNDNDRAFLNERIAHHEEIRRERRSVGPLHCAISLSMISCAVYGFYKLCQSAMAKDGIALQSLGEYILIFDEQEPAHQERVHCLLHQVACQILSCIHTITDERKLSALKELHARIIALTAQQVTRDQLIEIVKTIKSTVA